MSATGGAGMAVGVGGSGGVFGFVRTAFGSDRFTAFCVFGLGGVFERTGSGGDGDGALAEGVGEFFNNVTISGAGIGEDAPSGGDGGTVSAYHSNAACNSTDSRIPVAIL